MMVHNHSYLQVQEIPRRKHIECVHASRQNIHKHKTKTGKVTIPKHKGDVKKGTLNSILKQAGLKEKYKSLL